jgi:glycerophosphoryl diester phosphodiesterase
MPKACRHTTLYLPQNLTWLMWGYPNRLQARFKAAGSYIYLIGPQKSMIELEGVNTSAQFAKVPKHWGMGILTDAIETIGPLSARTPTAQSASPMTKASAVLRRPISSPPSRPMI